jgi:hypothetical protein
MPPWAKAESPPLGRVKPHARHPELSKEALISEPEKWE